MKKALSLLLSFIMLVSCFGVPVAYAADEDESYTEEEVNQAVVAMKYFKVNNLPEGFDEDIELLKNTEHWNEINLMGIDLDFLYSSTDPILWHTLDIYQKDESGKIVKDQNGNPIPVIFKDNIATNFKSINDYTRDLFYRLYGGLKLYTVENAVALANALGGVFYRDFEKLEVNNFRSLFGNETPNANEFYKAVVSLSKLDVIVQENWCSRGRTFCEPVVKALGGAYVDISSEHYNDGKLLAAKTLEAFFAKMNILGPIQTVNEALKVIMSAYETFYREPILALFTHKTEKIQNFNTVEFYNSFDGLLEIIFCNCDPMAADDEDRGCFSENPASRRSVNHFCPLDFPVKRFTSAADDDEYSIFMYYYLNLCGAHRNNAGYIKNIVKPMIDRNMSISDEDKQKVKSVFDGYFLNDIETTANVLVAPHLATLLQPSVNSIFDRLKNSLMVFLKKIADYFDYLRKIFTGELDYGQGNSPFM